MDQPYIRGSLDHRLYPLSHSAVRTPRSLFEIPLYRPEDPTTVSRAWTMQLFSGSVVVVPPILSLIFDIGMLLLPVVTLSRLHMRMKAKIGLIVIFSLALL